MAGKSSEDMASFSGNKKKIKQQGRGGGKGNHSQKQVIQKNLNQTLALIYLEKDIQLSVSLPNFLICMVRKIS